MPLLKWVNDADARRAASQVPFHLLERKAVYGDPDQAENNLWGGARNPDLVTRERRL